MKHKTLFSIALILVIAISVFSVTIHFIDAQTTPILSVVLSGTTGSSTVPSQGEGTTFNVDVRVDGIQATTNGINGYTYKVSWDPTVLALENINDPAAFLGSSSYSKYVTSIDINNTNSYILVNDIILDTSKATAGVSASSGVLSTLTFAVLSSGGSSITLAPSGSGVAYLSTPDNSGNSQDVQATAVSATYGSPVSTPTPTPTPTPTQGVKTPTVTSITYFPSTANVNSSLTLTAKVTGSSPTGTITWTTNSTTGTFNSTQLQLTAGNSSVIYRDTQSGNITITATYSGDSNNLSSNATIPLTLYSIDFSHDGTVNFQDTIYFVKAYINYYQGNALNPACDLNHDGIMSFQDLELYVHAYLGFAQAL